MKRRSEAVWRQVSTVGDAQTAANIATQSKLWDYWSQHPWNYLSGKDADGRPIIWTTDERDDKVPVKPFPAEKEYLKWMTSELWDDENRALHDFVVDTRVVRD